MAVLGDLRTVAGGGGQLFCVIVASLPAVFLFVCVEAKLVFLFRGDEVTDLLKISIYIGAVPS